MMMYELALVLIAMSMVMVFAALHGGDRKPQVRRHAPAANASQQRDGNGPQMSAQ